MQWSFPYERCVHSDGLNSTEKGQNSRISNCCIALLKCVYCSFLLSITYCIFAIQQNGMGLIILINNNYFELLIDWTLWIWFGDSWSVRVKGQSWWSPGNKNWRMNWVLISKIKQLSEFDLTIFKFFDFLYVSWNWKNPNFKSLLNRFDRIQMKPLRKENGT